MKMGNMRMVMARKDLLLHSHVNGPHMVTVGTGTGAETVVVAEIAEVAETDGMVTGDQEEITVKNRRAFITKALFYFPFENGYGITEY